MMPGHPKHQAAHQVSPVPQAVHQAVPQVSPVLQAVHRVVPQKVQALVLQHGMLSRQLAVELLALCWDCFEETRKRFLEMNVKKVMKYVSTVQYCDVPCT